jgi:ornithine cyclodeaminase
MLILTKKEIENLLNPEEVINAINKAFTLFHQDQFHMPDRMHAHQGDNTLLLMPCFTESCFGTKLVSVNPQNAQKGKPSIYGVMALNDGETGEPLAILNGAALTAIRTGAVGALGIKHTSPENCTKLGIIGTGIQGFTQAIFASSVRPIQEILVCDRNEEKAQEFICELKTVLPNIKINICSKSETLVEQSEIIICTTSSQTPVIPDDSNLLKGKSFIGIGSYKPDMREFPDALLTLVDQVWVDTPFAAKESGDLSIPISNKNLKESQIKPLSELIVKQNIDQSETSFFKSVGMALFDVVVAECMYKKALENNIGTQIQL